MTALQDLERRVTRMEQEMVVMRAAIGLGRWLVPILVSAASLAIVIFRG